MQGKYNNTTVLGIANCSSIASPALSVTYLVTVTSAVELQKPANKRASKAGTIQIKSDDEWDTLKAQLLTQIEAALKPRPLELELHTVKAYMPHIMPKPGWPLANEDQYKIVLERIRQAKGNPVVNVTIDQLPLPADANKENEPEVSKGSKRKDPAFLPGNLKRNANIQRLQEAWKCPGKRDECVGTHCYIQNNGTHLPLGHERLECWASAMVSPSCLSSHAC